MENPSSSAQPIINKKKETNLFLVSKNQIEGQNDIKDPKTDDLKVDPKINRIKNLQNVISSTKDNVIPSADKTKIEDNNNDEKVNIINNVDTKLVTIPQNQIQEKNDNIFSGELVNHNACDEIYQLSTEIHIYLPKSPCIFCYYAYLNLVEQMKGVHLYVYYSDKFNFNNSNVLQKSLIKNFPIYQGCIEYIGSKPSGKNKINYKLYQQNVLNCINDRTYEAILANNKKNLSFEKITLHSKFETRLKYIFKLLLLKNDLN